MANTTTPKRLGFGSPIEREYKIIDSVPLKKDPSVHMAKYIKRVKVGDEWKDEVFTEFVSNPTGKNLIGATLKFKTELLA